MMKNFMSLVYISSNQFARTNEFMYLYYSGLKTNVSIHFNIFSFVFGKIVNLKRPYKKENLY